VGIAVAAISIGYYVTRKRPEVIAPPRVRVVGLPDDLREVVEVIRASGGRMNQVELRRRLPYSEAKVSLMLSDLEDRGVIRKIKRGRANVIVLTELG
jgi:uncharacterized membrane protein